MKKWIVLVLLGGFMLPSISHAIDLKQSKFTQVVNTVEVIAATDKSRHSAAVNDVFKMPDVLRTGPDSRAELVAPDNTITRVGANTIFSFDPGNRTIDLQQGSILFHSPHGKGGGTIRTGSATASVIGTTIIVTSTPGGGFKLLDLEGQAEIRFLNGLHQTLEPGQMTFILPGGGASPIVVFRLDSQVKGSLLVNGFDAPLPSIGKIDAEITRQLLEILNNEAQDTGLLVGNNATPDSVQVRMDLLNEQARSGFRGDASVIGSDHTPNQPLPVNYTPLVRNHVVNGSFTPPNVDSINQGLLFLGILNPASGFVGNNIDIDTANVDLSSFAGKSDFDFIAKGDMKIWQSVNFTPSLDEPTSLDSGQPDTISLIAGGQMLIAPGSTLEADTGTFGLVADSFGTLDTDNGTVDEQNTLDGVTIKNSVGDIDILSLQDLSIFDSSICAGGGVDLESQDGTLTLGEDDDVVINARDGGVEILAANQVDIYNSDITAHAGNLNVTAISGSIYISDGDLEAYSSDTVACDGPSLGNVTIDGVGSVGIYNDTYIYGEGDVDISSHVTISVSSEDTASGGDLTIRNSQIEAGDSVDLSADGMACLSGDEITADNGSVTITGGGNVGIFSSTISANGGVDIESDGTLNVGNSDTITALDDGYDVTISAGGDVTLAANGGGDVNVTDTSISAGGNVYITTDGTVSLSCDNEVSDGNIDLESSDVTADFSVNVTAGNGSVTINNTDLTAGGGDVSEDGLDSSSPNDGDISIGGEDISIDTSGYASVSSGGTISISGADATISGSTFDVKGDTTISDAPDISTVEGDVTISGGGGSISISGDDTVSIDGTEILGNKICISGSDISSADGSVNITDNGSSGGSISITGCTVSIDDGSSILANNITIKSGSDISSSDGDVNITDNGSLTISGNDTAEICGSTINVNNIKICDSAITADNGCITIDNEGTVSIQSATDSTVTVDSISISGSEIAASGNVTITSANGDVTISDSPISATIGNETSTISEISSDKVSISSGGQLTITGTSGDNAYFDYDIGADSKICLSGASGVTISDAVITTLDSDSSDLVKISSGGTIDLAENVDIYSDGSVKLCASSDVDAYAYSSITANGGDVNICAGGNVDLEYTDVSADGSVNVNAGGSVTVYNGSLCMNDWNVNAGSFVDLNADGNTDVSDSDVYANGDIDVESGSGSIGLNCSTFSAGGISSVESIEDCSVTISGDGSSITVGESDNNDITINHSTFIAGGVSIADGSVITADHGDVTITGNGGAITIGQGDNNDITINCSTFISGGVTISDSQITANNGDVIITGNGGTVSIGDGDGNTVSESGDTFEVGNVSISGSTILANSGNVTISGSGDVTIFDSPISATAGGGVSCDEVSISSGGELSITGTDTAGLSAGEFGYDIGADHKVCLSGDDGVSIDDALIETLDGCSYDKISVTSDGVICITDGSELKTSGNVKVESYDDDVNILDSTISAGGDVCVSADGGKLTVNAGYDYLDNGAPEFPCDYDIDASGTVDLSGDCVSIKDTTIYGGCEVDVTGTDGNVKIQDADIVTDTGNVDIAAYGGDLKLESGCANYGVNISAGGCVNLSADDDVNISDSTITADTFGDGGNVNISAGDELCIKNDGDIISGDKVKLSAYHSVSISCAVITANDGCVIITAGDNDDAPDSVGINPVSAISSSDFVDGSDDHNSPEASFELIGEGGITEYSGDVNLSADDGVSISDVGLIADSGDFQITANGGDVDIESGSTLQSKNGGVEITANGGAANIDSSYVEAYDGVTITADGDVHLCDDSDVNGIYADNGDVDITSNYGAVDIDDTYISASGEADIESSCTLTLSGGTEIDADSVYLESSCGDVDIYCSTVTANGGSVQIYADEGSVDINNSYINAGADNNVSIRNGTVITASKGVAISANGGDVEIGGENVTVSDTTFDLGGNISIAGSCITANDGCVQITTSGTISISSDGSECVYGNEVSGASIDICDTHITSNDGGVDIENNASVSDADGFEFDGSSGGISIQNSTILANSGNVTISGSGDVTIFDSPISATAGGGVSCDEVSISSGGELSITGTDTAGLSAGEFGYDIGADHKVCLSGDDGVSIDDALIETLDGCSYDKISVTSDGVICITDGSELKTSGNVKVESYDDDVNILDSTISAGGDVCVSADGGKLTVNAGYDYLDNGAPEFPCDYDIDASGTVDLSGDCVSIKDTTIYGGCEVDVTGTDGNVKLEDVDITTCEGDVNVTADYGLTLESGCADYGVTITAGGCVTLTANDDVDIEGGTITANGGNVSITSTYGNVNVDPSTISSVDDVDITASYGNVDMDAATITADGSVNITAGGTLSIDEDETADTSSITGTGCVTLTANGDVDILGGTITATDGGVGITSNSGNVNMDAVTITAGGSVNIMAGGTLSIDEDDTADTSTITAGSAVTLTANYDVDILGGTITATGGDADITSNYGNVNVDSSEISSVDDDVAISAGFNVDMNAATVTAGGSVNITAGGTLSIDEDDTADTSTITAGGCVTLTANDDVDIEGGTITANGGNVSITSTYGNVNVDPSTISSVDDVDITASYGNVDMDAATITADGSVNITAGGTLSIDEDETADTSSITGTGCVTLTANGDVDILGGTITATDGGVGITSNSGNVNMDAVTITAGGSVNIMAGGTLSIDEDDTADTSTITAGSAVTLTANYDVDILGGTITATGGDADITSNYGNVNVDSSEISSVDDDVAISAGFNVDMNAATVTAGGSVNITAGGTLSIDEDDTADTSTITAGGCVTLTANDDVDIEGGTITANGGNVSITSTYGNVNVDPSTISSVDDVDITASYGNVDISDSKFYFGSGNDTSINNQNLSPLLVGEDENVSNSGGNGGITISAGGMITLQNSEFHPEGNLSISDSGISAVEGDVNITTGGDINLFGNCLSMSGVEIVGGSISISDSTITASNGGVSGGNVNIGGNGQVIFNNGAPLDPDSGYTAVAGDVCVFDSNISANGGDVNINSGGTVTLQGDNLQSYVVLGNNVNVNAQSGLTVSGVSINADPAAGSISLNNASGQTTINNGSSMQAFYINVNSPDGILINSDGTPGKFAGNTMNLTTSLGDASDDTTGAHSVTVCNTDLGQLATVNIQAHTVNMNNDNFSSSSSYNFTSFYHGYHINDGNVAGYVNFNNDTLDNSTAIVNTGTAGQANQSNNGGIVQGGSGAGIHVN